MKHMQTLRQIIVVSGLALCLVSDGFIVGQLSGMINALGDPSSPIKLTEDDISAIASTINITSFIGFAVVAGLAEVFGRRKCLTIISIPVTICWLMVYFAQDKFTLLASRAIVGISYGGVLVMTYINIGEYVSPNMRSFCLNLMSGIGASFGAMLGHVFSLFFHWKTVALIGIIPAALSTVMPLFWVESPSWLATQKRFDECEQAFRALHVHSEESEKELRMLIYHQRNDTGSNNKTNVFIKLILKYINACKSRYYWKIALLLFTIAVYRIAAGKILLNTYIIDIIQDITGTSNILQYTLVVDGFALIGSGLSCLLVAKCKMRTLLLYSGFISNMIQVLFAISLYFWKDQHMVWIKISLLAMYYITVTAGPYSVLETLLTELHPLEIKIVSCLTIAALVSSLQFLHIQFASKLFTIIGHHGVFLLDAFIVFLCLIYIYFQLPETKGRTLQEIECYFKQNSNTEEVSNLDIGNNTLDMHEELESLNINRKNVI